MSWKPCGEDGCKGIAEEGRKFCSSHAPGGQTVIKGGTGTRLQTNGDLTIGELKEGHLIFSVHSGEMLRFTPDGKAYVRGELVDDNRKVYEAVKVWLGIHLISVP